MSHYILSHDLGTTGDKAMLFSRDGELRCSAFFPYETFYPEQGWAEQNPDDYWEAFCNSTRSILDREELQPSDIAVVAFSGQMMAALAVDGMGNALRKSIIWADLRSTSQADDVSRSIGTDRVYEVTGHRLSASYSATKIMWIRDNEPEVYNAADKFIHAKDFLVAKLTGTICSDYSDATGMNLLDISSLNWSEELLSATGIERDKLPDLFESTDVVGKVTAEAAGRSGLLQGTPVVVGGGDGPCATCGAGVVESGDAYIYLGTSTWMGMASDRPLIDPLKRTFTFNHFNRGLYMPAGTMQSGGGSFKWFRDTLADAESGEAEKTGGDVYEIMAAKAAEVEPGAGGLLFLPYLMGERSPLWNPDARGCFIGLSMVHGKPHMMRAVLEGVAYNMRIIERAIAEQGVDCSSIRIIGGGAKSGVWRQIFADILEKPVERLNFIDEATSIGAAIAGGVGAGIFKSLRDGVGFVRVEERTDPLKDHFPIYRHLYSLFMRSYDQLVPVFDGLAKGGSRVNGHGERYGV
jgi:xylulokinase